MSSALRKYFFVILSHYENIREAAKPGAARSRRRAKKTARRAYRVDATSTVTGRHYSLGRPTTGRIHPHSIQGAAAEGVAMSVKKSGVSVTPFRLPTRDETVEVFEKLLAIAKTAPANQECTIQIWSGKHKIGIQKRRLKGRDSVVDVWMCPGFCLSINRRDAFEIGCALVAVSQ